MTLPPSNKSDELAQANHDLSNIEASIEDDETSLNSDEEHVKVTPLLMTIGIAAVVLGVAAGLVMSFTAAGNG